MQYLITDPCYIMDVAQYDNICTSGFDFEGQEFPLKSRHRETGEDIVFHTIEYTPNGDGLVKFQGKQVGVDSGMLCIVECAEWNKDNHDLGVVTDSLEDAKRILTAVMYQL